VSDVPEALLEQGLDRLGLLDRPGLVDALNKFRIEIETWNDRLGLVSLRSSRDLPVKHLLDSLAPWRHLEALGKQRWADLGSGAGFPGLPLALVFPQWELTLVERMERRADFLKSTLAVLGRTDVRVVQKTFEEVKERFEAVTFRAFTPLEVKGTKKLLRLLEPQGYLAAYKGRREVIDQELGTIAPLKIPAQTHRLEVPFLDEERHLVVLGPI